ncbi:hypothetical protein GCM10010238_13030 [Streptomyces griseoviridis]|uniref:Uncharacterized protein n=1 Tax=Streptomyces griseoviridis TaxID=45398 RepID=A0A918GAU7_STRGD|nr:hypothetical protein GCM10010238_13030 [Streptomyces niveoruber]
MHVNRPDPAHAVGPGRCLVFDGRLDLWFTDDHGGGSLHSEADSGTHSERRLHHAQHLLEVGDGSDAARTASAPPWSPAPARAASYSHAPLATVSSSLHPARCTPSRSPHVLSPPDPAVDKVFVQSGQDAEVPPGGCL